MAKLVILFSLQPFFFLFPLPLPLPGLSFLSFILLPLFFFQVRNWIFCWTRPLGVAVFCLALTSVGLGFGVWVWVWGLPSAKAIVRWCSSPSLRIPEVPSCSKRLETLVWTSIRFHTDRRTKCLKMGCLVYHWLYNKCFWIFETGESYILYLSSYNIILPKVERAIGKLPHCIFG